MVKVFYFYKSVFQALSSQLFTQQCSNKLKLPQILGGYLFQEGVQSATGAGAAGGQTATAVNQLETGTEAEGEVQPEVLDMRFPSKGLEKQITYIVLFPIIFPLWLTLPDTRGERGKSTFLVVINLPFPPISGRSEWWRRW